ncbi:transcriptional regulator [Thermoplasmatales archaeon ex4572_165]|nr:MAG: transcriptional regulator [Thermoplasmatales archaeon ex4572_165]RLF59197.1 MAG: transcriptional regulator [Thermoplasmata archaeon]
MKQTPCEYLIWNGIPVIRREIAKSMINDFKLNQRQTAEKLGITPAAVSQYISGKRGKIEVKDKEILNEIYISAKTIIEKGDSAVVPETCRLCSLMRKRSIFSIPCDLCSTD